MTEAWLLFDEAAIRRAAGNPNGRETLGLPALRNIERLPDPKRTLQDALRNASGLPPRRKQKFSVDRRVHLVAAYIQDYSPLLDVPAFQQLQDDVARALSA